MFYFMMELLATFTENVVAISAVTAASGPKFQGKRHLLWIWLLAAGMVVPVSILNQIQSFSFSTIFVGMLYVALTTGFTAKANLLVRSYLFHDPHIGLYSII